MRALAVAAISTSLALAEPAFAQGDPAKAEANKAEEQKKKESEKIERAYKDMLKRMTRGAVAICVGIACDAISGISESNESGG